MSRVLDSETRSLWFASYHKTGRNKHCKTLRRACEQADSKITYNRIALARETTTSSNCEKNWIGEKQIPVSLRWSQTVWQHFTAHFYAILRHFISVCLIFFQIWYSFYQRVVRQMLRYVVDKLHCPASAAMEDGGFRRSFHIVSVLLAAVQSSTPTLWFFAVIHLAHCAFLDPLVTKTIDLWYSLAMHFKLSKLQSSFSMPIKLLLYRVNATLWSVVHISPSYSCSRQVILVFNCFDYLSTHTQWSFQRS